MRKKKTWKMSGNVAELKKIGSQEGNNKSCVPKEIFIVLSAYVCRSKWEKSRLKKFGLVVCHLLLYILFAFFYSLLVSCSFCSVLRFYDSYPSPVFRTRTKTRPKNSRATCVCTRRNASYAARPSNAILARIIFFPVSLPFVIVSFYRLVAICGNCYSPGLRVTKYTLLEFILYREYK